MNVLQALLDEF